MSKTLLPGAAAGGGGTSLGIFEWECAAGTLESCTRASSREFGYPLFLLH